MARRNAWRCCKGKLQYFTHGFLKTEHWLIKWPQTSHFSWAIISREWASWRRGTGCLNACMSECLREWNGRRASMQVTFVAETLKYLVSQDRQENKYAGRRRWLSYPKSRSEKDWTAVLRLFQTHNLWTVMDSTIGTPFDQPISNMSCHFQLLWDPLKLMRVLHCGVAKYLRTYADMSPESHHSYHTSTSASLLHLLFMTTPAHSGYALVALDDD